MNEIGVAQTAGSTSRPWLKFLCAVVLLCCFGRTWAAGATRDASAAVAPGASGETTAPIQRNVAQWIERMHSAPCNRSYTGTFVVLSASGAMASSRIWHACDGQHQMERVEALSGTPRTTFRRNDEVRTFLSQTRVVRTDRREASGPFPRVPLVAGASIAQFYTTHALGEERVAGHIADGVWFKPNDTLRFGYRLWSEQSTGLVVKLQTLGTDGQVLEQAAFSELDLNAPVRVDQLMRLMDATAGYKVVDPEVVKTTAKAEGWALRQPVAGFVPVSCHRRTVSSAEDAQTVLQCLYSDGLASVSLFIESFDAQRHPKHSQASHMGATQWLGQPVLPDRWLTAVGEVPLQTLRLFAGQLERLH